MIIYNDILDWEGLSSSFGLARGKVRLRIFNLSHEKRDNVISLRPVIVVISDVPGEKITVRGWAGPLAGFISKKFDINKDRMVWIEYYPAVQYGQKQIKHIPETFDIVEFTWKEGTPVLPRWRPLRQPLLGVVRELMQACPDKGMPR